MRAYLRKLDTYERQVKNIGLFRLSGNHFLNTKQSLELIGKPTKNLTKP